MTHNQIRNKVGTSANMTKEDVIAYLKENPLKDITPEEFVDELLRDGQILMSDYLELQKAIELAKKPILEIKLSPEQIVWDIEKWLSYSKTTKVIFTKKEN